MLRLLFSALFIASLGLSVSAVSAREIPAKMASASCESLLGHDYSRRDDVRFRLDAAAETEIDGRATCVVTGYAAPSVRFEVKLPVAGWSGRYLQLGCGGYCGRAVTSSSSRQTSGCAPLESGDMVIASSNLGHERSAKWFADGLWAEGNPGAVIDLAYAATHKTAVVAKALIADFYGTPPEYSYFSGCSNGGREALQVAQRYPEDFDGILSGAPTIDMVATNTVWHAWNARANTGPDGMPILTADKIPALADAVLAACAGDDGLIADPRSCNITAESLICKGADNPGCLTPAQAAVVTKVWQGPVSDSGEALFAGGFPKGSERAWVGSLIPSDPLAKMGPATAGEATWSWDFPMFLANFDPGAGLRPDEIAFTAEGFDRITALSRLYDPTDTDLGPFERAGGKLVIWQGWADSGSSPLSTLNYVAGVRQQLGATAGDMLALYMVPGAYHCAGGPIPVHADFLSGLMTWVEDGTRPAAVDVAYETAPKDATVTTVRAVQPYESANAAADLTPWRGLAAYAPKPGMSCSWKGASLICD